ncbi:MAG: LD-carboxypeptidase, partial [Chitinophagaceae bacterium]|nr:LD-carboxypeptidase [Chitinophagaceae bacterium]
MNRKDFLLSSSSLVSAAALSSFAGATASDETATQIIPPYLKQGDTIGITSPAGYITLEEIQPAMKQIESWGYKIRVGEAIGKRDFTFGGTDEERANDFQKMLDDPEIKAILSARGGYGSIRIIDKMKWDKFKEKPKWVIGFSDITVFHSYINSRLNIASIHSKMCNSFPDDWAKAEPIQVETINSIRDALAGVKMKYVATPNGCNRGGSAEAMLVGGNLKTLETMAGSASDLITTGKILFVEDTGEYLYSIDRMFWNLKRSGKLSDLKGLIVGGFKVKTDSDTDDFGKKLEDIVLEKIKNYHYPVCFDFPVG